MMACLRGEGEESHTASMGTMLEAAPSSKPRKAVTSLLCCNSPGNRHGQDSWAQLCCHLLVKWREHAVASCQLPGVSHSMNQAVPGLPRPAISL